MATDNSLRPDGGVGDGGQDKKPSYSGMSLRDLFASQVIASVAGTPAAHQHPKGAAEYAYLVADAMLAQREAR